MEGSPKVDILKYAPKDIRHLILMATPPDGIVSMCHSSKDLIKYCGSVDFLAKYLEKWFPKEKVDDWDDDPIQDILWNLPPLKMMEICKRTDYRFCSKEYLEEYANDWGVENDVSIYYMFVGALKKRDVPLLRDLADFYYNDDPQDKEMKLFSRYMEKGDLEIFEIISNGRGTQEMFKLAVERSKKRGLAAALIRAATRGDAAFIKAMLKDKRIDPNVGQNTFALIEAAKHGHMDIVKILLADGRINPNVQEAAIKMAKKSGHGDIAELLEPKRKAVSPPDQMSAAARKYVEKLGEYHKEFAESHMRTEK
jgi:hypothetical protein